MCISGWLCVEVMGVIFSVLKLAEVVERLIMVEEHNHQAKMAEWRRLLQTCRDEEQRAATQGTRGCASS